MRVTFDHQEHLTSSISTFWFKSEKPVRNTPGQYTEIRLPHENRDKRGDRRWFTLSSSPTEELAAITTKFATENGSSFKQCLRNLQPGTIVDMAAPMGDFVLPKDTSIPLVFIAGGIGLTPFRSIAKWLTDTNERRNIQMLYAVNIIEDIIFKDLFESSGIKLNIVVKNPPSNYSGLNGTLDATRILELVSNVENKLLYIAGPEPMVEAFDKGLKDLGVNKKQLVADFFPGYVQI